jgi:histidine triad (HIT) family protein
MAEGCIFCKIVAKQVPSQIVHEDADCVAFRDLHPQAPTHVLIVPKKHLRSLNELQTADAALAGRLLLVAKQIAEAEGVEEGWRLVVNCGASAGQSVWHLHLHLLGGRPLTWPPG